MTERAIEAMLALRGRDQGSVGRDRIAMLEAVAKYGHHNPCGKSPGL
jgi:hypothetical protein